MKNILLCPFGKCHTSEYICNGALYDIVSHAPFKINNKPRRKFRTPLKSNVILFIYWNSHHTSGKSPSLKKSILTDEAIFPASLRKMRNFPTQTSFIRYVRTHNLSQTGNLRRRRKFRSLAQTQLIFSSKRFVFNAQTSQNRR